MTKDDDNKDGKRPHGRGGRSDRPGRPDRDTRPRRDDGGRDKPRKFAPRDAEGKRTRANVLPSVWHAQA